MRNISHFTILCLFLLSLTGMLLLPLLSRAQTNPPSPAAPQPEVYVQGTCIPDNSGGGGGGTPASTKFFVNYPQQPDSVYWLFGINPQDPSDSLDSREFHPAYPFSEPGTYNVELFAFYNTNGEVDTVKTNVPVEIRSIDTQVILKEVKADGTEEQISGEVVLCGAPKTINAYTAGQSGETPVQVTWYKPQSADPLNPEPSAQSITVTTDLVQGVNYDKYKDAGTYYIIYDPTPNDPTDCSVYQTFNVVIYNETDQNSSIWYFGNSAGINFMNNEAISSDGKINAPEGVALTGDPNADVLFATDGESVWYGNDLAPAANGTNIGGSPGVTQNSLFVDFPSDESLFYLFTINNSGQLSYSLLDLKAATPPPGVALADGGALAGQPIKTIPLTAEPVTEKLTSTSRTDGGVWVVTHELNSNAFLSFPVSSEGLGKAVRSEIGQPHGDGTGYLRFMDGGKVLASTYNNGSSNAINLYKFDADSGTVSEPAVELPVKPGTLYGLAFADSMMYATVYDGSNSYLYQFDVDSTLNQQEIIDSMVEIEVPGETLGAVELGPDGTLYIAREGSNELFTINSPGRKLDDNYDVTSSTFELAAGTSSTLGLPNFGENAGSAPREASISATGGCVGDDVEVSATQRYQNDMELRIELLAGDRTTVLKTYYETPTGEGAELTIPAADYGNTTGTFYVRLSISNECSPPAPNQYDYPAQGEEIISSFTISAIPVARLETPAELRLCGDQSVTFRGKALIDGQDPDPSTSISYLWLENGTSVVSNTPELTVDRVGVWEFIVGNGDCLSDPVYVSALDERPQVDLGQDINVCVGDTLPRQSLEIDNRLNDFTFEWQVDSGTGFSALTNTTNTQSLNGVNTGSAGQYRYAVKISSKSTGCFKNDTINIRINAVPTVTIVPSDNNCQGFATLTAEVPDATGQISYSWFKEDGTPAGRNARQIIVRESGGYYVEITDNRASCSSESDLLRINLEEPLEDLNIDLNAGCGEAAQSILTAVTSYTGRDISYQWFKKEGNTFVPVSNGNTKEIYATEGTYQVTATISNSNCAGEKTSEPKEVTRTIPPVLRPTYVICPNIPEMARDTISLEGYDSYVWRTANGQVVGRSPSLIITQEGNYELEVNGCSEPVRFRVVYDCTPVLWLPNAIRFNSPVNGNSSFRILNPKMAENVQNFQIQILNRWGEVLFQSNDPLFEWKGTDRSGQPVMVNTYVYVITYQNRFGDDSTYKKQRGGITVLK